MLSWRTNPRYRNAKTVPNESPPVPENSRQALSQQQRLCFRISSKLKIQIACAPRFSIVPMNRKWHPRSRMGIAVLLRDGRLSTLEIRGKSAQSSILCWTKVSSLNRCLSCSRSVVVAVGSPVVLYVVSSVVSERICALGHCVRNHIISGSSIKHSTRFASLPSDHKPSGPSLRRTDSQSAS